MTIMISLDERIEREVAALGDLSREELSVRWAKAYGSPPPKGVKRSLLERAAAWHLQAKHFGGLSPTARKAIRDAVKRGNASAKLAAGIADAASIDIAHKNPKPAKSSDLPSTPVSVIRPGMRLVREWNGRTHIVDVSDAGFVFDGKTYRSLSAIAKRITGAHWSGPRFFGL